MFVTNLLDSFEDYNSLRTLWGTLIYKYHVKYISSFGWHVY